MFVSNRRQIFQVSAKKSLVSVRTIPKYVCMCACMYVYIMHACMYGMVQAPDLPS